MTEQHQAPDHMLAIPCSLAVSLADDIGTSMIEARSKLRQLINSQVEETKGQPLGYLIECEYVQSKSQSRSDAGEIHWIDNWKPWRGFCDKATDRPRNCAGERGIRNLQVTALRGYAEPAEVQEMRTELAESKDKSERQQARLTELEALLKRALESTPKELRYDIEDALSATAGQGEKV
ncbi:hypothetical protein IYR97_23685 (plasmid) [Pseudomonas fulva]|jgi:hypothetical protein|uniref:Uncharacterized protein n=3 Tax=Pseudomonas TaxID=286 RepID=A0A1X0ZJ88_PSEPU|nr:MULTISPECIES: hypothetical protein [Pseudomonas]MCT8164045.1 hypothetical protein [Pseudomonas sp. HD6422]MCT8182967.1 hypothetical protein [Pseudomonas sp. HD6421]MDH1930430.1 hypothetical protein [Pseudomonas sp. GD03696]MDM1711764.1 hypothetical protein [Pseudomonas sp. 165]ORL53066.1 hypothetical protein B7H18_03525 [Pseudomonas putida]